MNEIDKKLKARLDSEVALRNHADEVSYDKPDPILVARRYKEPYTALVCALFGYGRADLIVRFLDSLDFSLLDADDAAISQAFSSHYYRFQNSRDIAEFFITFARLKREIELETLFFEGYRQENSIVEGINNVITRMHQANPYRSRGYDFLIGKPVQRVKGASALKRWMMFLRWMVRDDETDFGLWRHVDTKDLIIPLDTHTFHVSKQFGLLKRKTYDLQAAIELTDKLREFDPNDPVKYDFALYRIGQEKKL